MNEYFASICEIFNAQLPPQNYNVNFPPQQRFEQSLCLFPVSSSECINIIHKFDVAIVNIVVNLFIYLRNSLIVW